MKISEPQKVALKNSRQNAKASVRPPVGSTFDKTTAATHLLVIVAQILLKARLRRSALLKITLMYEGDLQMSHFTRTNRAASAQS